MTPVVQDYTRAFQDGVELLVDSGRITLHPHRITTLAVPSGKILACDPLVTPERAPFPTSVPPGRYPVVVSVAQIDRGGTQDQRLACAMVRFSGALPVRWRMATTPNQDIETLEEGYFFGYPVDSGIGCFMDALVARALSAKYHDERDYYRVILL